MKPRPLCSPNAPSVFGLGAAIIMLCSTTIVSAAQEEANKSPELGPRAVFKPLSHGLASDVAAKFQACASANAGVGGPNLVACVVPIMQRAGASVEAAAFTTMLQGEGYLDSFRKMGRVDLATIAYPLRANENEEYVLVNGLPRIVHVSDPGNLKRIDIKTDPLYPLLIKKFPKLELWFHADFAAMQLLPEGGQRFVFSFPLLNGCHACAVGGHAHIAFDFDTAGNFLGTTLLRLSKTTLG